MKRAREKKIALTLFFYGKKRKNKNEGSKKRQVLRPHL